VSNTVRDLRCTATPDLLPPEAHYECSVLYRVSEGPPPCACGAPRVPFYATREMQRLEVLNRSDAYAEGVFRPTLLPNGERCETAADLDRALDSYCARHNLTRDQVALEPIDKKRANESADEKQHHAWLLRKKNGYDDQTYRALIAENRRKKELGHR
jgi:hypothetical protein